MQTESRVENKSGLLQETEFVLLHGTVSCRFFTANQLHRTNQMQKKIYRENNQKMLLFTLFSVRQQAPLLSLELLIYP